MTPEAQRIAIAESVGFTNCLMCAGILVGDDEEGNGCICIPDYLNDLNAMQQVERFAAERLMNADQWEQFGRELERQHPTASLQPTSGVEGPDYYDFATIMADLTAAQHAKAFLRAIGKWQDDSQSVNPQQHATA